MSSNGFGESAERILNALMSKRLIPLDERSRANDVSVQKHGEFACRFFGHEIPIVGILQGVRRCYLG